MHLGEIVAWRVEVSAVDFAFEDGVEKLFGDMVQTIKGPRPGASCGVELFNKFGPRC